MLQKEADIRTVRANNEAVEIKIKAHASADRRLITVKAENDAHLATCKAKAHGIEIEAEARRNATIMAAEAEAKAIKLKGEAEEKYAKSVGSTAIGAKLAELKVQEKTLAGLQKIAYVPGMPSLIQSGTIQFNTSEREVLPACG